jgi:hypothetical protein
VPRLKQRYTPNTREAGRFEKARSIALKPKYWVQQSTSQHYQQYGGRRVSFAVCQPIAFGRVITIIRSRMRQPKAGVNTFVARKILWDRSRGDFADLPALRYGIIQFKTSVIG